MLAHVAKRFRQAFLAELEARHIPPYAFWIVNFTALGGWIIQIFTGDDVRAGIRVFLYLWAFSLAVFGAAMVVRLIQQDMAREPATIQRSAKPPSRLITIKRDTDGLWLIRIKPINEAFWVKPAIKIRNEKVNRPLKGGYQDKYDLEVSWGSDAVGEMRTSQGIELHHWDYVFPGALSQDEAIFIKEKQGKFPERITVFTNYNSPTFGAVYEYRDGEYRPKEWVQAEPAS